MASKSFVFRFGDVEVREREFSVAKAGETSPVEPKAFRVLLILLRNPGKLITKEELLNAVWGDAAVTENSLTRSIALLRRLLGDDARTPRFIETVTTVGYRWLGRVVAVEEPAAPTPVMDPPPAGEVSAAANGEGAVLPERSAPAQNPIRSGRRWITLAVAAVVLLAAAGFWYQSRPLPLPRITAYDQITHEGHIGWIAGTDGSRIYFNQYFGGQVGQVGVTGGDIARVPTELTRVVALDVSADGENLLLWSPDPNSFWTVGALGGSPRLIADASGMCGGASWSPDGKSIAYADCQGNLLAMRSDGAEGRKLVTVKGIITNIAWSPDASRIRFTVDNALWEISSTGGNLHPLLTGWKGPAGQCCGRWTPDGDFYLFLAGGNNDVGAWVGGFEQIWILDERHPLFRRVFRAPLQLTSGPTHWDSPIPSRDGGKIFAVGTTPRGELVRFDPGSKQLQPFLGGISAEFLSYSKDGAKVAYVTYPDGILWRAKADGTERLQLTSPPLYPKVCRWSPDGSQILFTAQRDPSRYALYSVPAQGGTPRLLVSGDDGQGQEDGNWSPDGRKIVYSLEPQYSLRIFDLDRGKVSEVPRSNGLFSPRWSPDGRYIAAMNVPPTAIKIFDLQSQQWSTLADHLGGWAFPTWSQDGKFIYALMAQEGWSVQRLPVMGGAPQRVVDLSNTHLIGAVGFWFGLDPNDTPILLRNNGTSDIYALTLERK